MFWFVRTQHSKQYHLLYPSDQSFFLILFLFCFYLFERSIRSNTSCSIRASSGSPQERLPATKRQPTRRFRKCTNACLVSLQAVSLEIPTISWPAKCGHRTGLDFRGWDFWGWGPQPSILNLAPISTLWWPAECMYCFCVSSSWFYVCFCISCVLPETLINKPHSFRGLHSSPFSRDFSEEFKTLGSVQ